MKYTDKGVEGLKIAYVGGGSRGWAWGLMSDLAVAGDIGCLSGPYLSGVVADAFGQNLRAAFVFATIFPLICLTVLCLQKRKKNKEETLK